MSVIEQQAEELCINTARGGEGGRHEGNALVIRIIHRHDDDDDDVYYPKGRKPREDEKGEESYEKQRQRRPGGRGLDARSCASTGRKDVVREVKGIEKMSTG